jgi:HK97 gp10 family phage protein
MKTLTSFGAMAMELMLLIPAEILALHEGLEIVAQKIEKTAKAEIGTYQDAAGPFPAWPLLADSTEDRKAQMGYPADAPLLATGDMRDSIGHQVEGLEAAIGSTDPVMVFHEFGTSKMPARPVMGPAAFTNKAAIEKLIGAAVVAGLVGGDQIHKALGYDFETKN